MSPGIFHLTAPGKGPIKVISRIGEPVTTLTPENLKEIYKTSLDSMDENQLWAIAIKDAITYEADRIYIDNFDMSYAEAYELAEFEVFTTEAQNQAGNA